MRIGTAARAILISFKIQKVLALPEVRRTTVQTGTQATSSSSVCLQTSRWGGHRRKTACYCWYSSSLLTHRRLLVAIPLLPPVPTPYSTVPWEQQPRMHHHLYHPLSQDAPAGPILSLAEEGNKPSRMINIGPKCVPPTLVQSDRRLRDSSGR